MASLGRDFKDWLLLRLPEEEDGREGGGEVGGGGGTNSTPPSLISEIKIKELLLLYSLIMYENKFKEIKVAYCIVFVCSQYDGGNINKEQWLRFLW